MTRPEYSFERDLSYSKWHRTLSPKCYTINLDWVEVRFSPRRRIIGIIEDKDNRAKPIDQWKHDLFIEIGNALNAPAFLVLHDCCGQDEHKELWRFKITHLQTNKVRIMTEPEYRQFIETGLENFTGF